MTKPKLFKGSPHKPVVRTKAEKSRSPKKPHPLSQPSQGKPSLRENYYMVHNSVWEDEAGLPGSGCLLCLWCLERRLGRLLRLDDFTQAPVNWDLRRAYWNTLCSYWSRTRPGAEAPEVRPVLVFGSVVIAKRGYLVCSQPVTPIQFGTPIMPEGFMTETGLLPDAE